MTYAQKATSLIKRTINNKVYKIAYKRKWANCSICPWNRGENSKHKHPKNWKGFRDKQWKRSSVW